MRLPHKPQARLLTKEADWDACLAALQHPDDVNAVAISPDGLTCVSGSKDKTVRCVALFEACTGPPVHV